MEFRIQNSVILPTSASQRLRVRLSESRSGLTDARARGLNEATYNGPWESENLRFEI